MEFLKNVVDYFDNHPGYELLMSFAALVFSTIPYIWRAFKKRFHLKAKPLAFKVFSFNEEQDKNLAIQIAVTNLSEAPCTITQASLIIGNEEKYISFASENLFFVKTKGKQTAEYYSLGLPQNISPHQGVSGCFVIPNFKIGICDLKKEKCTLKLICGNKTKMVPVDFESLYNPLFL